MHVIRLCFTLDNLRLYVFTFWVLHLMLCKTSAQIAVVDWRGQLCSSVAVLGHFYSDQCWIYG